MTRCVQRCQTPYGGIQYHAEGCPEHQSSTLSIFAMDRSTGLLVVRDPPKVWRPCPAVISVQQAPGRESYWDVACVRRAGHWWRCRATHPATRLVLRWWGR